MKTIVLGYPDEKALGKAVMLAGPELSQSEQIKIFNKAKEEKIFPAGIERVEFVRCETGNIAIRIKPAPVAEPKPETKKETKK